MAKEFIRIEPEVECGEWSTLRFKIIEYKSKVILYRIYAKECDCFLCIFFSRFTNHKNKEFWKYEHSFKKVDDAKNYIESCKKTYAQRNEKPIREIEI